MELTDAERAEFIALTQDSLDPELWTEDDLPYLRRAKQKYEEEQARERAGARPAEEPTMTGDGPRLLLPRDPEPAKASMACDATFSVAEPLRSDATRVEPAALCPQDPRGFPLSEPEKERHAEGMTDEELAHHVESKLRPVGESLRNNIAYIREARERFAHPGRRVPVPGKPTFTQWIRQNLGISERHVRRLLAAAKKPADRSREDEMEPSPNQGKRDEMMWQAGRMAHAALGLVRTDERDPSGLKRKSALIAMAQEFLNLARRKHISLIVRLKELQPGNFHAICAILAQCCDTQLDQVFGSLDESERSETLRLLAKQIGNRYENRLS
jgi:hypothetical protein